MRSLIFPGEEAQSARHAPCTYCENGRVFSSAVGMLDTERGGVVPLEGPWVPRIGEQVVGTVTDSKNHVYTVDLSYYCRALIIGSRYDRESMEIGDVIEATIKNIEDGGVIILSYPKMLLGGVLVNIKPAKVPRVIGKEDTMVRQIESLTRTRMVVGRNGTAWIKGKPQDTELAICAISLIERKAHQQGLTEAVKVMLENESRNKKGE